jgi:maltose O-acetyltransferase
VKIESNVLITHPQHVVLKDRALVHSGAFINSVGGLHVGENTGIGYNCSIFTAQHHYRNAASIPFDKLGEMKPVIIREFVWIGANAMILPGVEIGEGSIIGMGAVVTKNIPPLAIVLGNPAEIVMYRDKEHYFKCKSEGRIQDVSIDEYEYRMVEVYRRKYRRELQEMGLL